jgi:hypothetical protein
MEDALQQTPTSDDGFVLRQLNLSALSARS